MRTETREVRIGEWFTDGTVDDWLAAHAACTSAPPMTDDRIAVLRQIVEPPPPGLFWLVSDDGDFWHRVQQVGLYDGWPYWRPRIAVGTDGPISCTHTREGYQLRGARLGRPDPERKIFPYNGWRFA